MSDTTHDGGVALGTPPSADEGLGAAQLAAKYGLTVSGARPGLLAYMRQLWGRRHFILAFSRAKLTAQYSQAKLGQLWQVVTPLLNAAVYYLIFGLILGTREGISHDVFVPFLVTGVFVFTFTQSSVMAGVRSISGNLGLVRALHFPRASLPISFSLQQLQQLMFSMIVLVAVAVIFGSYPSLSWLLVIPALILQFGFNTGLALVMARLGAKTPRPRAADAVHHADLDVRVGRDVLHPGDAEGQAWIADVLQYNPAAIYMDLVRFALIDGYGSENLPDHVWAA